MEKADITFPKLTRNEQSVLKKIIDRAKIPDLEIAKEMGLSQQAILLLKRWGFLSRQSLRLGTN
jgi:hypothetical protein